MFWKIMVLYLTSHPWSLFHPDHVTSTLTNTSSMNYILEINDIGYNFEKFKFTILNIVTRSLDYLVVIWYQPLQTFIMIMETCIPVFRSIHMAVIAVIFILFKVILYYFQNLCCWQFVQCQIYLCQGPKCQNWVNIESIQGPSQGPGQSPW